MDAAAEFGRNAISRHQIQPEYGDEQADAGRDCRNRLARPNSLRERGKGNINFPCLADHEQDWQPYPVDPYSCYICYDHAYIHPYKRACITSDVTICSLRVQHACLSTVTSFYKICGNAASIPTIVPARPG